MANANRYTTRDPLSAMRARTESSRQADPHRGRAGQHSGEPGGCPGANAGGAGARTGAQRGVSRPLHLTHRAPPPNSQPTQPPPLTYFETAAARAKTATAPAHFLCVWMSSAKHWHTWAVIIGESVHAAAVPSSEARFDTLWRPPHHCPWNAGRLRTSRSRLLTNSSLSILSSRRESGFLATNST